MSPPEVFSIRHVIAIVLLTLFVYAPTWDAGFIWDDDVHLTADQNLQSLDGLKSIWLDRTSEPQYYPFVHSSFWLEYRLWQLNPRGYHVDNVLLHAANAILFAMVLRVLNIPGAFLAALIFAVHPVHVESVAWITERKNVLSGVFFLLAALSYWRWAPPTSELSRADAASRQNGIFYSLAFVLFCCALLSKTVTGSLPAVILVVAWWKHGRIRWSDVRPLLPMFAVAIVAGIHTSYLEKHHVGATGDAWSHSFAERFVTAGKAVWFYAIKLVWPHPLVFFYPKWNLNAADIWSYAFPLTAIALPLLLLRVTQRLGRAPVAAFVYFGGTLLPALGFFNVYPMRYASVADHFQYLASLSLISLFAASATLAAGRSKQIRRGVWLATSIGVLVMCVLTWQRATVFQNPVSLWSDTIQKNPKSSAAWHNLGVEIYHLGYHPEAVHHIETAIAVDPQNAEARFSLGSIFLRANQQAKAISEFKQTLAVEPKHPGAHVRLGEICSKNGDYLKAIQHFETAIAPTGQGVLSGDRDKVRQLRHEIERLQTVLQANE